VLLRLFERILEFCSILHAISGACSLDLRFP